MKKVNADKLDKKYSIGKVDDKDLNSQIVTGLRPFPKYKEYEKTPGADNKD